MDEQGAFRIFPECLLLSLLWGPGEQRVEITLETSSLLTSQPVCSVGQVMLMRLGSRGQTQETIPAPRSALCPSSCLARDCFQLPVIADSRLQGRGTAGKMQVVGQQSPP